MPTNLTIRRERLLLCNVCSFPLLGQVNAVHIKIAHSEEYLHGAQKTLHTYLLIHICSDLGIYPNATPPTSLPTWAAREVRSSRARPHRLLYLVRSLVWSRGVRNTPRSYRNETCLGGHAFRPNVLTFSSGVRDPGSQQSGGRFLFNGMSCIWFMPASS